MRPQTISIRPQTSLDNVVISSDTPHKARRHPSTRRHQMPEPARLGHFADPGRRDFFRYSGAAAAVGTLAGVAGRINAPASAGAARSAAERPILAEAFSDAAASGQATPGDLATDPIRPPAVPLAVRGPYLSTWLPATELPGTWPQFWTGHTTAMGGIVRVDGTSYMFMGAPTIVLDVPNGNNGSPSTVQ